MNKVTYIQTLPKARNKQLSGFYSSIVDLLSAGNRGQALTWAINGANLSTNPAALQAAYDRNPEAIDGYVNQVNIDKLPQMLFNNDEVGAKPFSFPWVVQRVPAFGAGAVLGIAGIVIWNKIKT